MPRACSILVIALVLGGCGQKGALVHPSGPAAAQRATLPETLTPASMLPGSPASAPPTGTASPVRTP
ncbi:LPS translocon maturation chaperone LptM [Ramlibacter sp.]|uniref:LPS translocon maturation chaperone LptM n=1 Tax=Ramlibacter sp. TaxID=1917967 RepID=UPI003D12B03F